MKSLYHVWIAIFVLFISGCTTQNQVDTMKSYPEFDLQGHRGARGILPENTIPSLIKALEHSVTTLEFDIVVSADSQLVLSHEPWFHHHISSHPDGRAVTQDESSSLNMFQMNYDEIRQYDVGLRGHINFPEQQPMSTIKPLMKDAIKRVEAHISEHGLTPVWYNIETKTLPEYYDVFTPQPEVFAALLYAELADLGVLNRVTVQSFDVNTLKAMRKIDERVPLVLLVYNENGLEWNLEQLGFIPEIYSPYFRYVDENLVSEVHSLNMKLIPWTVNNQEDMLRLIHLGVDGLITDYPNRAIALPEVCERLGFPPSEG